VTASPPRKGYDKIGSREYEDESAVKDGK
jgi:hypothetical protein